MHFARELAAANGFADRTEFIQRDSRKTELPERVNVIVSDIRGSLPYFGHAIASMDDARRRLLAPGGRLIPLRDTLRAAVIEASDFYAKLVSPWEKSGSELNLLSALPHLLNASYSSRFAGHQVLTEPQTWSVLDYSADAKPCVATELTFPAMRPGTAHGLCLWFETELLPGIGYSSEPGSPDTVYGQVFLPWLQPVRVETGTEIFVRLQANLVGEEYIWRWETKVNKDSNDAPCFQQSTFLGANFTSHALRRRAADFVPTLSEEGQLDRWFLQSIDGKTSLQQMAQAAVRRFPGNFPRWEDALSRAAELARRFSR